MRRHRLDLLSLLAGVLFVLTGLAVVADQFGPRIVDLDSFWPVALVLGGFGLLLTLRGAGEPEPATPPTATPLVLDPELDPDHDLRRALELVEQGLAREPDATDRVAAPDPGPGGAPQRAGEEPDGGSS